MKRSMRAVVICLMTVCMMFSLMACGEKEGNNLNTDQAKTIEDYLTLIPMQGDTYQNENYCYTLLKGENQFGWITMADFQDEAWSSDSDESIINLLQNETTKLTFVEKDIMIGAGDYYVYSFSNTNDNVINGYYVLFGRKDSQYAYVICMDASYVSTYGYMNLIQSCLFNESSFTEEAYKDIEYQINKYKEGLK